MEKLTPITEESPPPEVEQAAPDPDAESKEESDTSQEPEDPESMPVLTTLIIEDDGIPGSDLVIKGSRFNDGIGVEQNDSEAIRYYEQAAKLGNALGMHNLALMYLRTASPAQNIQKGLDLLYVVAKIPPMVTLSCGKIVKNVGVYAAQHCLGIFHYEGLFLPQEYEKAAYWFRKSALNGLDKTNSFNSKVVTGQAANNLALIYHYGKGFPKSPKMAEMFWRLATDQGNMCGAYSLHLLYKKSTEPEAARLYFELAIDLGLDKLNDIKAQTLAELDKMDGERKTSEESLGLREFEHDRKLDRRGLTMDQRLWRMGKLLDPTTVNVFESVVRVTGYESDYQSAADLYGEVDNLFLQDPRRMNIIKKFRAWKRATGTTASEDFTQYPGIDGGKPTIPGDLTRIRLFEMNPLKEMAYPGRILNLTLIEEPVIEYPGIRVVAEDEYGDAIILEIGNILSAIEIFKRFGVGSKLGVVNPHLVVPQDAENVIRVEEQESLIYLGNVVDMCRYCGKGDAPYNCSRCKKAKYCDRHCQKLDWKVLEHRLVCNYNC